MGRSHIAAALGIASFGLLITVHLISQLGLPNVGFFHFKHVSEDTAASPNQIPLSFPGFQPDASDEGPAHLLGVGKADITG